MALACSKNIVECAVTSLGYTLKAEQEQAIQAKQCEYRHSILHLLHCHTSNGIVQLLTAIMQQSHSYDTSWLTQYHQTLPQLKLPIKWLLLAKVNSNKIYYLLADTS